MAMEKGGEGIRADGRSPTQFRPLICSRNVLHRAHGSARWSQGDTVVLAAVYGPRAGVKKNESPEKASVEVIWKPHSGQIGKGEREFELILMRTLRSICLLNINPNTTTTIVLQVVNDDGALLTCAINASCAALIDAGIPLKHLAVAVSCAVTSQGSVIFDPTKSEEREVQASADLVFPNTSQSGITGPELLTRNEPAELGIITSVTHGVLSVSSYIECLECGRAASSKISEFLCKNLEKAQFPSDPSRASS